MLVYYDETLRMVPWRRNRYCACLLTACSSGMAVGGHNAASSGDMTSRLERGPDGLWYLQCPESDRPLHKGRLETQHGY
jgi:hypothetical protein